MGKCIDVITCIIENKAYLHAPFDAKGVVRSVSGVVYQASTVLRTSKTNLYIFNLPIEISGRILVKQPALTSCDVKEMCNLYGDKCLHISCLINDETHTIFSNCQVDAFLIPFFAEKVIILTATIRFQIFADPRDKSCYFRFFLLIARHSKTLTALLLVHTSQQL